MPKKVKTPAKTAKEKKKTETAPPKTPKGMHDILPPEQPWWDKVRNAVEELSLFYNFGRIETPLLEYAALFERGVGEETDVVRKQMYTVKTKGGDLLVLRPEGTAPIARAYLEHNLGRIAQPQKLYYEGPMFRRESPQAGRYREHHQVGFEIIGGQNDSLYDAQIILIFDRLLSLLKLKHARLTINSIGCRICRPLYRKQLVEYYRRHEKDLCEDCRRRLMANPLRLLDCKEEGCEKHKVKAPNFLDKICVACTRHFQGVLEYLDELSMPYALDNQLVRGFDYYSRTVFEFFIENANVGAVAGGGRYDYLIEMLGGRLTPAVGGAAGIERIILAMKSQEVPVASKNSKRVFLVHIGEFAKKKALPVIEELRRAGIPVVETLGRESLKAQLRVADREKFPLALILGQKEIYEKSIIIRDLRTGVQELVALEKMVQEIKKRW